MKIVLRQHGGLAAFVRRPPLTLDTGQLDERTRDDVDALARGVASRSAPPPPPLPDEITYSLTIADDGAPSEIRATDTTAGEDFSRLVQVVKKHGTKS